MSGRVLIVEDDRALCEMLEEMLARRGYDVAWTTTPAALPELLREADCDVVVTDLNMPGTDGLEICARVAADRPDVPVIVITAFGDLNVAIAAIRAGAYDFLTKPFDNDQLALALDRAVRHRSLRAEVKRLRQTVRSLQGTAELVGASPPIRALRSLIGRIAQADASVLISGETGTGKELVARALHGDGPRAKGPFVALDCAALPESLIESELFGHARGAFTDASRAHHGLLRQADGGTLFLDEIGNLPPALQPKLLRAIQERRFRPVGAEQEVAFDARILAATNRDLGADAREGRFREDLYYRLDVLHVEVPPLRARGNDVLVLAQHFLAEFAERSGRPVRGIAPNAAARLLAHPWPGNVRELRNCIERAVALAEYDELRAADLPEHLGVAPDGPAARARLPEDPGAFEPLEAVERRYILRVLAAVGGNKTVAARILGLDRKTLRRKLGEPDQPDSP